MSKWLQRSKKTYDREKIRNSYARKIRRKCNIYKQNEQNRNTIRRKILRQRFGARLRETMMRRIRLRNKSAEKTHKNQKITFKKQQAYNKLFDRYKRAIADGPYHICSCCGGLWFKKSVTLFSSMNLIQKGITTNVKNAATYYNQPENKLCFTCKKSIFANKIPRLSLSNGLDFPDIPMELQGLSALEERLVSARLPFMQIRDLGYYGQKSLRGNVVNVENDLDTCVIVLPRKFDETNIVDVQLMRRMSYKKPYMWEKVRPLKVYNAAKYLSRSELYLKEDITLSDSWKYTQEYDTLSFVLNSEDENEIPSIYNEEYDEMDDTGSNETLLYSTTINVNGIRIAPGESNTPLPLRYDVNAEELSFPTIYCGQIRKYNPKAKLTYTDIVKSELKRYDRRACIPTKVLYSFKKSFNEKVYSAVQICLRKKAGCGNITASQVKTQQGINTLIQKDEGYAIFKNIRSSPSYWKEKTKKVMAMIRQFGRCTFFITFSAAESKWVELHDLLYKTSNGFDSSPEERNTLTKSRIQDLINKDPVTCMRYFDHKFRCLLNMLMLKENGMFFPYKISEYFSRMEFQMRGSPHQHGIYWLENAPFYNKTPESEKKCVDFIDAFITCQRFYEDSKTQEIVNLQLHNHSHSCRRRKHGKEYCRFGYPKPPFPATYILEPLEGLSKANKLKLNENYTRIQCFLSEKGRNWNGDDVQTFEDFIKVMNMSKNEYINSVRSTLTRTTVFLKRKPFEAFINSYNLALLLAWEANMDIQFVVDTYACAQYCVSYVTKCEGGQSKLLRDAIKAIKNGNESLQAKFKKYASHLINKSEISSQEASAFLLGIPNTKCSRQDIYINTSEPNERIKILKSQKQLESLDENSEDICCPGLIEHYQNRPDILENTCLADFASQYDIAKFHKDGVEYALKNKCGFVKLRTEKHYKVIRYRHYNKDLDDDNFYREMLMLFLPWRCEEKELLNICLKQKYGDNLSVIKSNSKRYIYSDETESLFVDNLQEMDSDGEIENSGDESVNSDEEYCTNEIFDIRTSDKYEQYLPPKIHPPEEFCTLMRSLNNLQRKFVYECLHRVKLNQEPFYFFLSGGAGVGKSHVITAIVQGILRHEFVRTSHPDQPAVIVSAPTGKAAFNIMGMTNHCAFKLPPTQYGLTLHDLDGSVANTLRQRYSNVKLFIIDEISMVGLKSFYQIDQRLRQIFGNDQHFGGRSVLVVGDFRQLKPVIQKFVFKVPDHIENGLLLGNYLWEKFQYYQLTEIMRQKDDKKFCKALNNLAMSQMDCEDILLLKSRETDVSNIPMDCIRLFKTNKQCEAFNGLYHNYITGVGYDSVAVDKIRGKISPQMKQKICQQLQDTSKSGSLKTDGLPYRTHLKVGAEYFISTNVDVADGLFNGSTGTLMIIDTKTKTLNNKSSVVPVRVWMDFHNPNVGVTKKSLTRREQTLRGINLEYVAIEPITRNLTGFLKNSHSISITRKQIPLVSANAMTICKSQGSTLKKVSVCLYNEKKSQIGKDLLYVGCSRSSTLNGLYIDGNFTPPEPPQTPDEVTLEIERLKGIPVTFTLRFFQDYDNSVLKLFYHNIQYFIPHKLDMEADQCVMLSDIIVLVEPHVVTTDHISLSGFKCVYRYNAEKRNSSQGFLIFCKDNIRISEPYCEIHKNGNAHFSLCTFQCYGNEIVLCYKSPGYTNEYDFTKQIEAKLIKCNQRSIVIGDFNKDLSNKTSNLMISCNKFGFKSLLAETEVTTNGGTTIDGCFTNFSEAKAFVYESYYSYHKPVLVLADRI